MARSSSRDSLTARAHPYLPHHQWLVDSVPASHGARRTFNAFLDFALLPSGCCAIPLSAAPWIMRSRSSFVSAQRCVRMAKDMITRRYPHRISLSVRSHVPLSAARCTFVCSCSLCMRSLAGGPYPLCHSPALGPPLP